MITTPVFVGVTTQRRKAFVTFKCVKKKVRESVQNGFIEVKYIAGVNNPSDLFTKEDTNATHHISIQDQLMCIPPNQNLNTSKKVPSPRGVLSTTSVHA